MENRNGLLVDFRLTEANGRAGAPRSSGDVDEALAGTKRVTVGADKGYDTREFVAECRKRRITRHVAKNEHARRRSAIDGRTTSQPGYAISQRVRKLVEEIFGWVKTVGNFRRTRLKGRERTQHAGVNDLIGNVGEWLGDRYFVTGGGFTQTSQYIGGSSGDVRATPWWSVRHQGSFGLSWTVLRISRSLLPVDGRGDGSSHLLRRHVAHGRHLRVDPPDRSRKRRGDGRAPPGRGPYVPHVFWGESRDDLLFADERGVFHKQP